MTPPGWPSATGSAGCCWPATRRTSTRRPAGGLNLGVQDAFNLGWKLAAEVNGWVTVLHQGGTTLQVALDFTQSTEFRTDLIQLNYQNLLGRALYSYERHAEALAAMNKSLSLDPQSMMIYTGVFTRHPQLKIVDAEVNFGWIPYWKQQMDQSYEQQKGWARFPFAGKPSATLGKNVFVTVLDDKVGFDMVEQEPVLAEVALFSIDYPHSVCLWPNTAKYIEESTENVAPAAKRKILAGNAQEPSTAHRADNLPVAIA